MKYRSEGGEAQTLSFTSRGITRITGTCRLILSTGRGNSLAFGGIGFSRHEEKPLAVLRENKRNSTKKSTYLFDSLSFAVDPEYLSNLSGNNKLNRKILFSTN